MIFKILALALDNSILFQTLNKLILASYKQEDTDFMFKGSIYLSLDTLLKMIFFFFYARVMEKMLITTKRSKLVSRRRVLIFILVR